MKREHWIIAILILVVLFFIYYTNKISNNTKNTNIESVIIQRDIDTLNNRNKIINQNIITIDKKIDSVNRELSTINKKKEKQNVQNIKSVNPIDTIGDVELHYFFTNRYKK